MRIQRETIGSTCAFCQGILIFLKKNYLGVAEFKNSCIFATAMETLSVHLNNKITKMARSSIG